MPGLLQVGLVGSGEPVLTQTRVDRFLSSPQRVDVGMISGEAGSHLGTLGNGAVAGDQDNEPAQVTGEFVQIGTIDAGIDQDQPTLPASCDYVGSRPGAGRRPPEAHSRAESGLPSGARETLRVPYCERPWITFGRRDR